MEEIKSTIDANITPNGEQGITGSVLNRVLNDMVDATEGKLAQLDQEWQEIKDANFNVFVNPHIEVVDMGGQTAATIEPDKYYIFGVVYSLAVGFAPAAEGKVGNYAFQFTSPAEVSTSLSLPIEAKFPIESGSALQIKPNTIYQISVLNGLAVATSWEV